MRTTAILLVSLAILTLGGCSHSDETRVADPDAGGPIVNPLAPGAKAGLHAGAASAQEFTAPPGMKTGIPK